jgi:hypothetical protein
MMTTAIAIMSNTAKAENTAANEYESSVTALRAIIMKNPAPAAKNHHGRALDQAA